MIVSIVSPCCDEFKHIDSFLRAVTQQQTTDFDLEILIAEGGSKDGTAEVLAAWRAKESRITVVPNPSRIVSTGLNAAIRIARGEIIVRMDAHTEYAEDYVAQCVRALKQSGATCVGGPWLAKGSSLRQAAIAAAFNSPFGCGGAKSRRTDYTGPIDTVYLGTWWRRDLIAFRGFDESLVRDQDDELCLRITRSGGTIWQSAAIRSFYLPRGTFSGLWRQFYEYGYWKAAVIKKYGAPSSIRQLVPTIFIALLAMLTIVGLFVPSLRLTGLALLTVYVGAAIFGALVASESHRPASLFFVLLSFICMHSAYGTGFGHGVLDFLMFGRRPRPDSWTVLARSETPNTPRFRRKS